MKKSTILSIMLAGTLAAGFTSCSDDDNTTSFTAADRQEALASVRGNYTGKIYRMGLNDKNVLVAKDSAAVTWSLQNDSIMTIQQFPVHMLAEALPDSAMIKAVREVEPQNLTCYIGFVQKAPAAFIINPSPVELKLNYGGTNHALTIGFLGNSYYSYGRGTKSQLNLQIYEYAYKLDNGSAQQFKSSTMFQLVGKAN